MFQTDDMISNYGNGGILICNIRLESPALSDLLKVELYISLDVLGCGGESSPSSAVTMSLDLASSLATLWTSMSVVLRIFCGTMGSLRLGVFLESLWSPDECDVSASTESLLCGLFEVTPSLLTCYFLWILHVLDTGFQTYSCIFFHLYCGLQTSISYLCILLLSTTCQRPEKLSSNGRKNPLDNVSYESTIILEFVNCLIGKRF